MPPENRPKEASSSAAAHARAKPVLPRFSEIHLKQRAARSSSPLFSGVSGAFADRLVRLRAVEFKAGGIVPYVQRARFPRDPAVVKTVTIVVPAFCEGGNLRRLHADIRREAESSE